MEHGTDSHLIASVHVFSKWTLKQMEWQPRISKMFTAVAYAPGTETL